MMLVFCTVDESLVWKRVKTLSLGFFLNKEHKSMGIMMEAIETKKISVPISHFFSLKGRIR